MPYNERDLFAAVLAGRTDDIPDALRPVADTLAALRAAPVGNELSGEAAARAEFRAFMHAAGADSPAVTLVLPGETAGTQSRRAARHRRRPPSRRGLVFSPGMLVGAAAAVVFLLVIGLTTIAPNSLKSLAHLGPGSSQKSAAAQGKGQRGSMPSVQGTASREPTATPVSHTAIPSQQSPAQLCQQFYNLFLTHPQTAADRQQERTLGEQLSVLAGGWFKVWSYCARQAYQNDKYKHHSPDNPFGPGGFLNDQGDQGATGNAGQH